MPLGDMKGRSIYVQPSTGGLTFENTGCELFHFKKFESCLTAKGRQDYRAGKVRALYVFMWKEKHPLFWEMNQEDIAFKSTSKAQGEH